MGVLPIPVKPGGRKPDFPRPLPIGQGAVLCGGGIWVGGDPGVVMIGGAVLDTPDAPIIGKRDVAADVKPDAIVDGIRDIPGLGNRHTSPACAIPPGLTAGPCTRGRPLTVCGVAKW